MEYYGGAGLNSNDSSISPRTYPPIELREKDPRMYCYLADSTGLTKMSFEVSAYCYSVKHPIFNISLFDGSGNLNETAQKLSGLKKLYTFRDFSTVSWIHLAIAIVLIIGFACNIYFFQKQRITGNRNQGARIVHLSSILMDIFYCFQAIIYSSVYFIRSVLHEDAEDIEQCVFVAINIYILRLVFLFNMAIVILRFTAIFCPFWFYNYVTTFRSKIALVILSLIASVETGIIISQCLIDSLAMLSHIYWGISTLILILFIASFNLGLLAFAHYIFIKQRDKLMQKNGTYELFQRFSKLQGGTFRIGILALSPTGVQIENDGFYMMLTAHDKRFIMQYAFREHTDKVKFKRLLKITAFAYIFLVLPHFAVQVLAHLQVDLESWGFWKWAFFGTLFLVNLKFLMNPFVYWFNQWELEKETLAKRNSGDPVVPLAGVRAQGEDQVRRIVLRPRPGAPRGVNEVSHVNESHI